MTNMKKILCSVFLLAAISFAGDWAVVTSPSSPISSISKADLKRVFTGKKSDLSGVRVVPFMLSDANPAAVAFLQDVLDMSSDDYKKFWVDAQVRGDGTAPSLQKTSATAMLVSADLPGAIAVVDKSAVNATVKAITVH
jgi:hypothetical protein